jgi:hypothetical protein
MEVPGHWAKNLVRNVDENLIAVGAEKQERYYYSNLRPLGA